MARAETFSLCLFLLMTSSNAFPPPDPFSDLSNIKNIIESQINIFATNRPGKELNCRELATNIQGGLLIHFSTEDFNTDFNVFAYETGEFITFTAASRDIPRPCLSQQLPQACLEYGGAFNSLFPATQDHSFSVNVVLIWTPPFEAVFNDDYFAPIKEAIRGCMKEDHLLLAMRSPSQFGVETAGCIFRALRPTGTSCRAVTVMPGESRGQSFSGYVWIDYLHPRLYQYVPRRYSPEAVVAVLPALA